MAGSINSRPDTPSDYITNLIAAGIQKTGLKPDERSAYQRAKQFTNLLDFTPAGIPQAGFDAGQMMGAGANNSSLSQMGLGAAMGIAGLIPVPGAKRAAKEAEQVGIKAYHGSPHLFDKFDSSKIGTGEGAQVYGHGLYFAEHPDTATAYRDALSSPMLKAEDGTIFDPQSQLQHLNVRVAAHQNGPDLDATIARAQQLLPKASDQTRPMIEHDISVLQGFKDIGGVSRHDGHMYEVNINAHPDHFLDWDKPLGTQSPEIQKAVRDAGVNVDAIAPTSDVGSLMSYAHSTGLKPSIVSDSLSKAGIPGIKYLDQGSRTAAVPTYPGGFKISPPSATVSGKWMVKGNDYNSKGMHFDTQQEAQAKLDEMFPGYELPKPQETRNYVVFDPSKIDILKRYAIPAAAVGTGAAGLALQPEQQATQY